MMVKRFCVFAAVFGAVFAGAACADLIPVNNFFKEYQGDMLKLERRVFIVNSPNGHVIPQKKPGEAEDSADWGGRSKKTVLPKYENGYGLIMEYAYIHAGEYWGLLRTGHDNIYWPPGYGWFPMVHLLAAYAPADFERENGRKFYEYTGSYDAVMSAENVVIWQWPGSDKEKIIHKKASVRRYNKGEWISDDRDTRTFHFKRDKTYKDREGREWGEASYGRAHYRRILTGWICLSDPENSDIPAFNPAPAPVKWSPYEPPGDIADESPRDIVDESPQHKDSSSVPIIILVAALVAGTAVLARVFWKPNKTKPGVRVPQ